MKIYVIGIRGFPNVQGGAEKHCEELYPRLAASGYNITIIARTPYILKPSRVTAWKGVNFIYLWAPRQKNLETIVHSFLGVVVCLFKRPNIVHIHNIGPALFTFIFKLAGIKTILTYHSINYKHQKWGYFGRLILKIGELSGIKFADQIIVVSKIIKDMIENKYGRKNLKLIYNGVNINKKKGSAKTLKKLDLQPGGYIFSAARFVHEKGLHDLIAAFMLIKNPDFKLVIAGDADHETKYSRHLLKSAQKSDNIILTGFIAGQPLHDVFSNAGLFVLPSYHEGLPISLLEAMGYGLPVLATNISANRVEALPEYRFFAPGDVKFLSQQLTKMFRRGISEEDKRRQQRLISRKYNWDKIVQQTMKVFTHTAGK